MFCHAIFSGKAQPLFAGSQFHAAEFTASTVEPCGAVESDKYGETAHAKQCPELATLRLRVLLPRFRYRTKGGEAGDAFESLFSIADVLVSGQRDR